MSYDPRKSTKNVRCLLPLQKPSLAQWFWRIMLPTHINCYVFRERRQHFLNICAASSPEMIEAFKSRYLEQRPSGDERSRPDVVRKSQKQLAYAIADGLESTLRRTEPNRWNVFAGRPRPGPMAKHKPFFFLQSLGAMRGPRLRSIAQAQIICIR